MRVLQAMAGAPRGGAERHFEKLATALAAAGLDQRLLIRHAPAREAALAAAGIPTETVRFGGPLDLASRWRFRRAVRRHRPDLVLTWMSRASALCPPVPLHVGRLGGYYDPKYFRRCHHLIVGARGIGERMRAAGWPAGRLHYLPNFVAVRPAAPAPRPAGVPLLLALGRLHPNKAFDVLLAALAQVPEAHLWLLGDGPLRAELAGQARSLGIADRVELLPWQDDTAPFFAAADLVVFPSRVEPIGSVTLEAWAHRRPLIATATGGPAELIADGRTGLLVPVDDADALARAIRRVLGSPDLAAALAAEGRAAYEREFTEAAVVAGYLDLFGRLVGGGRVS